MISTQSIKTTSRAAIAALIIGAASISAMPAQAANTNFGFSFNSGNGLTFSITEGQRHRAKPGHHRQRACLSNQAIRQDLRQAGFRNIRIVKQNGKRTRVKAKRGRWEYVLRVNRCNGNVATLDRQRLHNNRVNRNNNRQVHQGGLNLQFNFR